MQSASLEVLEKAAVPPGQARAIVNIEALRGELRSETHAVAASGLKQMYGAMLGQLAVLLLGVVYFFVTYAPR